MQSLIIVILAVKLLTTYATSNLPLTCYADSPTGKVKERCEFSHNENATGIACTIFYSDEGKGREYMLPAFRNACWSPDDIERLMPTAPRKQLAEGEERCIDMEFPSGSGICFCGTNLCNGKYKLTEEFEMPEDGIIPYDPNNAAEPVEDGDTKMKRETGTGVSGADDVLQLSI